MKGSSTSARSGTGSRGGRDSRRARAGSREYEYIDGSAVRKLQAEPAGREHVQQRGRRQPQGRRKEKAKAAPLNMGYIMVMAVALLIVCAVLLSYVKLQSDITNHVTNISKLESQLNEMRLANDETYTKIMSEVDLEEIKRIAVNELGMKYAKEGQVIEYTGEGNDYVRQYSDIPD